MSIIEKIWAGKRLGSTIAHHEPEDYKAVRKRYEQAQQELEKLLSEEARKLYVEVMVQELQLDVIRHRMAFADGFRLGVQILLDGMKPVAWLKAAESRRSPRCPRRETPRL